MDRLSLEMWLQTDNVPESSPRLATQVAERTSDQRSTTERRRHADHGFYLQ